MKRKAFEIKAADAAITGNRIVGAASVMGKADRAGDVIFPGFFKPLLREFLASGFVSDGHDWGSFRGIAAMPVTAREEGTQLYTEAEFHSTAEAQATRTVALERMQAGLSVGLSVGFRLADGGMVSFQTGTHLLDYAAANGYDLSLFDERGLKARKKPCYGLVKGSALYEYSIVPVPCMPDAVASGIKAAGDIATEREFEQFLREAGYSRAQAVAITLHGFKAVRDAEADLQRDADSEPDDSGPVRDPAVLQRIAEIRSRLIRLGATR